MHRVYIVMVTADMLSSWFLDNPDLDWTPPDSLLEWMDKARSDGKPIVYIGFGSITVPNPAAMTRSILKAVKKSGVRAIISKGWSARMSKSNETDFEFPPECYVVSFFPSCLRTPARVTIADALFLVFASHAY